MTAFGILQRLRPLNLFEAHGSICCEQMLGSFEQLFMASCYQAKSLTEANFIVLWGSFSMKLAKSLNEPLRLGAKKFVIHVQGCESRVNNQFSFSSINDLLPIDRFFPQCSFSNSELEALMKEARQCLRA